MYPDFEMIVHKLPDSLSHANIYSFGDKHIGSAECDLKLLQSQIEDVLIDPNGFCVMCGDMLNFAFANSKSNVYQDKYPPHEQKEIFQEMFNPLAKAGKVLAAVPGNHCERATKAIGINPMYDVFCRWGIEDVYRENVAVVKISLGRGRNGKPIAYAGVVKHGASQNKDHKYNMGYDNVDFFISGHTHTPSYTPRGKMRIDMHNERVSKVGYKEIVVDSSLKSGGYALKNQYEISAPPEKQILTLYGDRKRMKYISEDY